MKLGLGLYRHQLNRDNYRFARQAGCTDLVVHYVDYFKQKDKSAHGHDQPTGSLGGWGLAGDPDTLWTVEELSQLREEIESEGLRLAALENFDPAHWYDVLLGGSKCQEQLEKIKTIITHAGAAGIPCIGYNFSIAGVAGRTQGKYARGGAVSVGMEGAVDEPMPRGMAWNMTYDPDAPPGVVPSATPEELWQRLGGFLAAVLPVAEKAGVVLAAHPDDPPLPSVRSQPRLVYQPRFYQDLLDLRPSPSNALEFCLGSLAEMTEGNVYDAVEQYSSQGKLAYVHFRNVRGKAPFYKETFVDDGDIDMIRVLQILKKNNFTGVLIPDHTPQMSCAAPWHAGMAFALGYMRAALHSIGAEE